MLGGAAISWRTYLEVTYVTNTAEAEYYASCGCTQAVKATRELRKELGWQPNEPTKVQIDNNSTIYMALSVGNQKRTKHIAVRDMIINQAVDRNQVTPEHIDSDLNPADMFTKPVDEDKFQRHRSVLMGKPDNDQFALSEPLVK